MAAAVVNIQTGMELRPPVDLAYVRTRNYSGVGSCYADNSTPLIKAKLCRGVVKYEKGRGVCPVCGIVNRLVEPHDDEVF
jgi:hypothetical protein